MPMAPLTPEEQLLVDAVSAERLMSSTRSIAQWVRLSGTPEEAQAFDWIQQQLDHYGLDVHRYSFPALVSWPESASLTITTGDGQSLEIPCSTHAFAAQTPPEGLEGDLIYVGSATEANLRRDDVRGKIILADGIVAQNHNLIAEASGVLGSVWIAGSRLHERLLSPSWGTPTPETAPLMPKTPSVSVVGADGARIKAALAKGPARARLRTKVFLGWKEIPCLTGDLKPAAPGPEADSFVLLSGHVDAWYYGAMDNGSANATMLEVCRLLAQNRKDLRRGVRVAFWSGHSHGRYAGSAWYADTFWQDLHDHCVAHVNVDSTGANGATVLSQANSMEQLRSFGSEAIEQLAGQRLEPRRFGRAGDQSFWGHGIPSLFMSLSEQPPEGADPVLLALHHQIGGGQSASGGLGWWWHTPDDTVDKIDPNFLRRDTSIYAVLVHRLCTWPLLPLDYGAQVRDLQTNLSRIQAKCGAHFDLSPVSNQLVALAKTVDRLQDRITGLGEGGGDERYITVVNRCLMQLGWALIPVDYTRAGPFDQDLATPTKPLPGLQPAAELAGLEPDTNAYHFLHTRLVRERNRVVAGLVQADRAVATALRELETGKEKTHA